MSTRSWLCFYIITKCFQQCSERSVNEKLTETHFVVSEHCRHAMNFIWKIFCLPFYINFSSLEHPQELRWDRRGCFYSSCCFCFSDFHIPPPPQHKYFNQSPTLFAVMWKPTIWQPSQSKPKQDSSDSWRLLCKIKQGEKKKKYFIFLKIFSSPTASTLSYLKSMYSKITMKTAKTWDQWRVNTPQKRLTERLEISNNISYSTVQQEMAPPGWMEGASRSSNCGEVTRTQVCICTHGLKYFGDPVNSPVAPPAGWNFNLSDTFIKSCKTN